MVASVGKLVEGTKNGKESICCGGSLGSLSLSDDQRRKLTENALTNLTAHAPDAVVTAFPLCKNSFGRYASVPVLDIAEIISQTTEVQHNVK